MLLDGMLKHLIRLIRGALEIVVEVEKDGDETEQCHSDQLEQSFHSHRGQWRKVEKKVWKKEF
jgi:hypothetical protein